MYLVHVLVLKFFYNFFLDERESAPREAKFTRHQLVFTFLT